MNILQNIYNEILKIGLTMVFRLDKVPAHIRLEELEKDNKDNKRNIIGKCKE